MQVYITDLFFAFDRAARYAGEGTVMGKRMRAAADEVSDAAVKMDFEDSTEPLTVLRPFAVGASGMDVGAACQQSARIAGEEGFSGVQDRMNTLRDALPDGYLTIGLAL